MEHVPCQPTVESDFSVEARLTLLTTAFAAMFLLSFLLHAFGGLMQNDAERLMRGLPSQGLFGRSRARPRACVVTKSFHRVLVMSMILRRLPRVDERE